MSLTVGAEFAGYGGATAALNTLHRHDALDCAEALGLREYEGGISRRGTSSVLIRVGAHWMGEAR